ncbi:MAG: hypothetical protein ORN55_07415 [Chitinophagaceae bacterium]|nr:hypothetical protein [Chitinophagaceae bacterium]
MTASFNLKKKDIDRFQKILESLLSSENSSIKITINDAEALFDNDTAYLNSSELNLQMLRESIVEFETNKKEVFEYNSIEDLLAICK